MNLKSILPDNINEYADYVDEDMSENIGRMFYRGLAAHAPEDDSLLSLLIWELKSPEGNERSTSELKWIYSADPSYISNILDGYHSEVLNDGVKKTIFESSSIKKEEENALSESGFTIEQVEGSNIDVTLGECSKLPLFKKHAPLYVQSLNLLDDQEFLQGIMNILFKDDDPALEDIAFLSRTWYEPEISCYTKTDGKVTGLFLVHACPSGILTPVLLFALGADAKINIVEMLRFSVKAAEDKYPEDTVIRVHRRNLPVKKISAKLFPDKKGTPSVSGVRNEE